MPGNAWVINATDYGHGDALEQFFVDAIQENLSKYREKTFNLQQILKIIMVSFCVNCKN